MEKAGKRGVAPDPDRGRKHPCKGLKKRNITKVFLLWCLLKKVALESITAR
ncbi:hypothetical protein BREVNS_0663 [Brevinematales bacterium NS]|nr:hypothetical protein BREVNS_0663 [Brevinematales bacterium NS]